MKLRLKKFEIEARRRARAELRKSPAAWREYKRVRRRREVTVPPWAVRFLPPIILMSFWGATRRSMDELVALALFISLASAAWRAGQLLIALRSSPRLAVYAHLPLSNEQVFELQWQYFLRTSAWSIADFTVFYGILADRAGYGWTCWLTGLAMAVAQWLVILAAATCFLAYIKNRKVFRVAEVLAAAAAALFILPSGATVIKPLAALAAWVPPMGWILYSMGISPPHNVLFEWWTALSFATVLFSLPLAYRRLRADFKMPEVALGTEVQRGAIESWRRLESDGSNPDAFAGITAAIRRRDFLKGFDWRRAGWVERAASWWLTPCERVMAEFLSGGNPRWSRRLIRFGLILGGIAVLVGIFPRILPMVAPFSFPFLLFVPRLFFGASWPGAAVRKVDGNSISICSAYPIGFGQIARATIKSNLTQLLILAPFLWVAGCVSPQAHVFNLDVEIRLGLKIMVVIVGFAIMIPVALISPGTNDGSKWRMVLLTIVWAAAGSGSCGFFFFAANWGRLLSSAGLLLGVCGAAVVIYGHAYNHNWFDLQNKQKETLNARRQ